MGAVDGDGSPLAPRELDRFDFFGAAVAASSPDESKVIPLLAHSAAKRSFHGEKRLKLFFKTKT